MSQAQKIEELSQLYGEIKSEYAILFSKQGRQIYKEQHNQSFVNMCTIMDRACEIMPWRQVPEITGEKGKSGYCGDWNYHITGCCNADITLYNTKNGLQMDIQQSGDEYKLMDCQQTLSVYTDIISTIHAIAYFMQTGLPTPSLAWIPDPEVFGYPKEEEHA